MIFAWHHAVGAGSTATLHGLARVNALLRESQQNLDIANSI